MYYRYIDAMRGFAAVSVLIWHYQHFYYPSAGVGPTPDFRTSQPLYDWLWPFYLHGGDAVPFFWMLSGFIFAARYLGETTSGWSYFVNRFSRLYPLHLLTLLIVAVLQYLSFRIVGHHQIYLFNDLFHFILNVLFIQHWGLQKGFSFNAPSWSVSVEVAIYILFFFTIPLLRRASLALLPLCAVPAVLHITGIGGSFAQCAVFFYVGTACFLFVRTKVSFGLCIGMSLIVLFFTLRSAYGGNLTSIQHCILFSGIILTAAAADILVPPRPSRMDWLGRTTYSTYLLHVPLQITILILLQAAGINQSVWANQTIFLVGYLLAVLAIGVVAYRWIEMPSQKLLRKVLGFRSSTPITA